MITWNQKKEAVIAALKKYGYNENQTTGNYQKSVPFEDSMRIATVYLEYQPKPGENIPVMFINPDNLDEEPSNKEINGVIDATEQIIRKAINSLETEEPVSTDEKANAVHETPPTNNKAVVTKEKQIGNPTDKMISRGAIGLSVDIIQTYVNPDLSPKDAYRFMMLCRAHDLNPFLNEVYPIVYKGKATFVVGVGGNMRRAQEQPDYDGYEAGIIVRNEDGNIEEREGSFMTEEETLLGGWCKVYRKEIDKPFVSKVSLKEYKQLKPDGTPNKVWAGMPATMIEKVPVSQCHRNAYMGKNGNLYEQSEMRDLGDVEVI